MSALASAPERVPLRFGEEGLDELIGLLRSDGYRVIGPRVRDGAILYEELASVADLPEGWGDEQAPGHYRLRRRTDHARFGYAVGPQTLRRLLQPPEERLWTARRDETGGWRLVGEGSARERLALLGIRGCELAALGIQDRVLTGGLATDPAYRERRSELLIVAVACTEPAGTCFCTSWGTGPWIGSGADLVLVEVLAAGEPYYVAWGTSTRGADYLERLGVPPAQAEEVEAARAAVAAAEERIRRSIDVEAVRARFPQRLEATLWEEVGARCQACTNCTFVCPTCFCSHVGERTDLAGDEISRVRRWDSCFVQEFSHLHGGAVRRSFAARYRHWFGHKLVWWHEQFGTDGCVGCGRCITWCPVGIDLTAVAADLVAEGPVGEGRP